MFKRGWALLSAILFCSAAIFIAYKINPIAFLVKSSDAELLRDPSYGSVFLSSYPITEYQAEDFVTYRGEPTAIVPTRLHTDNQISAYLYTAFHSGHDCNAVFLGLDPSKNHPESFLSYFAAYPSVSFDILLSCPSISAWGKLSTEKEEALFSKYEQFVQTFASYQNVYLHFPGAWEWLNANPANYRQNGSLTPEAAHEILVNVLARKNLLTTDDSYRVLSSLRAEIENYRNGYYNYPDLSSTEFIFFGDSIFCNYTGNDSIPGVVAGFSHAAIYNLGIGGTTASTIEGTQEGFPYYVQCFLDGTGHLNPVAEYQKASHKGKSQIFLINYGLNDYFNEAPIQNPQDSMDPHTYIGALRTGIAMLREAYPEAGFLLLAPNYSIQKKDGLLTDYVSAAQSVAKEEGIPCLDAYSELMNQFGDPSNYLSDGTHPNELARFFLGTRILDLLTP